MVGLANINKSLSQGTKLKYTLLINYKLAKNFNPASKEIILRKLKYQYYLNFYLLFNMTFLELVKEGVTAK